MPIVSVIIPTRNRARLVPIAIESVLAIQSPDVQTEIIVVDDGSTDDTAAVVQQYPVTYLSIKGGSASHGRNAGLQAMRGDYVTFLDDDDAYAPDNLIPQVKFLEQHPEYGAVCTRMMLADEHLKPVAGPFPADIPPSGNLFETFLGYVPQCGTMFLRAEVARAIGGFDLSLYASEDWDWALRAACQCEIGFIDHVAVYCRQHQQSRDYNRAGEENHMWQRFNATLKVYHKHTRGLPWKTLLKARRQHWSHRGWYIPDFMKQAGKYARNGNLIGTLRCLQYAVRISPPHVVTFLLRATISSAHVKQG